MRHIDFLKSAPYTTSTRIQAFVDLKRRKPLRVRLYCGASVVSL